MKKRTPPKRKPTAATPRPRRETRDVTLTILAVVVAVWARAAWLTPLILAAPLAFYLARGAATDPAAREVLARRWSITVFVTCLAATAFAFPHTLSSVPFAADLPGHIDAWLGGDAGPVLGARYMLASGLATLVLTAASAGIAGAIILASILALNAAAATMIISRGHNIIQMALVAVSPWQWCFMVGLVALYTPISVWSRDRVLARDGAPFTWEQYRAQILIGAGLILLAFIVRFALAAPYVALVRYWTIH